MTKQWTNMGAGRELDALIAEKVMGWRVVANRSNALTWEDSNGILHTWFATSYPLFRPSTDIAAAWLVVEKLADEYYVDIGLDHGGAQVQLDRLDGEWELNIESIWADTAPLAICLAALEANDK